MKRQAEARKIQEEKKLKKEAERDMEKERAENYRRQEESRQMELQRLEQLKMKAMMQQQKASSKVELKYYTPRDSRPGEFGFGNVTTGQVSMKKYEILARASSVGRSATEDRENLNPDLVRLSHSARASPSPIALQQQMASLSEVDKGQAMMVQVTLVLGFLAQVRIHFFFLLQKTSSESTGMKADFATSTQALSSGLSRRQVSSVSSQQMSSSSSEMKSMSSSSQQVKIMWGGIFRKINHLFISDVNEFINANVFFKFQ